VIWLDQVIQGTLLGGYYALIERAEHGEIAMSEIDNPHDAEHQR